MRLPWAGYPSALRYWKRSTLDPTCHFSRRCLSQPYSSCSTELGIAATNCAKCFEPGAIFGNVVIAKKRKSAAMDNNYSNPNWVMKYSSLVISHTLRSLLLPYVQRTKDNYHQSLTNHLGLLYMLTILAACFWQHDDVFKPACPKHLIYAYPANVSLTW